MGTECMSKTLWKDHWHWLALLNVFISVILPLPLVMYLLLNPPYFSMANIGNSAGYVVIISVYVLVFFGVVSPRLAYFTESGIAMGTAMKDLHIEIPKSWRRKVVPFSQIDLIEIHQRDIDRAYFIDKIPFLEVVTKSGEEISCYINDSLGFSEALKNTKYKHLLAKESYVGAPMLESSVADFFKDKALRAWLFRFVITFVVIMTLYVILKARI